MLTYDYGFYFNGHHSSEFGLKVLMSKQETLPAKRKVTVTVPYRPGIVDLSGVYGNAVFEERTVTYPCRIYVGTSDLYVMHTEIAKLEKWLMNTNGKIKLIDDAMPDRYFMAEVQEAPTFTQNAVYVDFTIIFQCEPFKYKEQFDDLWDTFNFDLDIAQDTHYEVTSDTPFKGDLINNGIIDSDLTLRIKGNLTVKIGNQNYSFDENTISVVSLPTGKNIFEISGNGTLDIDWIEGII